MLEGPVLIVGAGLLGTSIGLALRRHGVDVAMRDVSEENLRIATGLGAANLASFAKQVPRLVVVAVPPDHLAGEIAAALDSTGSTNSTGSTDAVVTDVGSVKAGPLRGART